MLALVAEPRVTLLDPELAERVLERALARGGDFAELYAEARAGFALSLDDATRGAPAERPRARRVGARGRGRLDLLRPRRRAGRGGPAARGRLGVARRVRGEATDPRRARARRGRGTRRRSRSARRRSRRRARPSCCARATSAPARAGAEVAQVARRLRRGPARRSRSATPTGAPPATTARACGSARRWWRAATTASRPARRRSAGHAGFELFEGDPAAVADEAARRALTMLDARRRARPGRCRSWSATASAACCSTRRPATGSSPTPCRSTRRVYAGRLGEKLAASIVTAYDDGTHAGRVGDRRRSTTRARPRQAHDA